MANVVRLVGEWQQRQGWVRRGEETSWQQWQGVARRGWAWRRHGNKGVARQGWVRRGEETSWQQWHGGAWLGRAGLGMETSWQQWHGGAGLGATRQRDMPKRKEVHNQ